MGFKVEEISKELMVIILICEIIRILRSLGDIKDWKGEIICILGKVRINMYFVFINLWYFRGGFGWYKWVIDLVWD